jgi:hydrogenase expression/formation protein HypE
MAPPPARLSVYANHMSNSILPTGKLPAKLLADLLASNAPIPAEVLLGPSVGEDAAAIQIPSGTLVVATDPITFTGERIGRSAVIINANDVAVTGVRPRWFLCTALFPPETAESDVRALFAEVRDELAILGAALVGGHTEVTRAVTQPVVVGQFLGLSPDGSFVRTGGLSAGDRILQVGPAPVEGGAVLASRCRPRLAALPKQTLDAATAASHDPGISVVEPALAAAGLNATSLHDPTEGGLATALWEVAVASGVALVIDPDAVLWFEPGLSVCEALGADPWGTLASGTLLAGFAEDGASAAAATLREDGYAVSIIGRAEAGAGVTVGDSRQLPRFEPDEVARILSE